MSPTTRVGHTLWRGVAIACVLGLLVAGGLWWTLKDAGTKTVTAYFPTTIGLYPDNSVRMLGVDIGSIETIQPQGERVKVTMTYDRTVDVPADAQAVIVAPSLVSDRYVQLTPAYTGGPELENGAVINEQRTAVPLEVDDLYNSLSRVSDALGPKGANRNGALSRLLDTLAENFKGNGKALNVTINKLGKASGTLAGNKDDLFATVSNLAEFSKTLADSDADVAEFQRRLADVSGFLADERHNLATTVDLLGSTLGKVRQFVDQNRDELRSNVDKLAAVTRVLVNQRKNLAEIMDVGPVALGNVINTYNASAGTLDARPVINELREPLVLMMCDFIKQAPEGSGNQLASLCEELAPMTESLPSTAQVLNALYEDRLPPLPLELMEQMQQGGGR